MPAARYTFLPLSDDTCLLSSEFELYECGNLLVKFARLFSGGAIVTPPESLCTDTRLQKWSFISD